MSKPLAAALALLAVAAPAAHAGSTTGWTRVTPENDDLTERPGLARSADGALDVTYRVEPAADRQQLWIASFRPGGPVADAQVGSDVTSVSISPTIVPAGSGLVATFGAVLDADPGHSGTYRSAGPPWPATPTQVHENASDFSYAPDWADAVTLSDGTIAYVHTNTAVLSVQIGTSPPVNLHDTSSCCDYAAKLAWNAKKGQLWLAWYSNASGGKDGVWWRQIDPATGAGVTAPERMVGTQGSIGQTDNWVALTGRPGRAGMWIAYLEGSGSARKLWIRRAGDSRRLVTSVPLGQEIQRPLLAPDAQGRMWILWAVKRPAGIRWYAKRSDPVVHVLGAKVPLPRLAGTSVLGAARADATGGDGVVDLLARIARTSGKSATYHVQAMAGLTLTASRTTYPARTGARITFRVTDAGVPVKGAKVVFRGRTATTDAKGRATIKAPAGKPGSAAAKATRTGWYRALLTVKALRG